MLLIVDFSHWQNEPDPAALKAAGVVGIIHKCDEIEASPQVDSEYHRRRLKYQAAGFLWAAYCYADGVDGATQADLFLSVVAPLDGNTAIVLDLEKYANLKQAEQFILRCRQVTGVYPILYSRREYIINEIHGTDSAILKACLLWLADPNNTTSPPVPLPWSDWFLWQHGTVTIGGVAVDRDWFDGNLDELKELWKLSSPASELLAQVRVISPTQVTAYKTPNLKGEVAGYYKVGDTIQIFPQTIEDTENPGVFFYATPEQWMVLVSEVQTADNTNPQPTPTPAPVPQPSQPVTRWVNTPGTTLRVRLSPSTTANVLQVLPDKTQVQITPPVADAAPHYVQLFSVNGKTAAGYVSNDYLTATKPNP